MIFNELDIPNTFLCQSAKQCDKRGSFQKLLSPTPHFGWESSGEDGQIGGIKDIFYSRSIKGVFRGMHIYHGDETYYKYVTCVGGSIVDYIYDPRPTSPSQGTLIEHILNENDGKILVIPTGVAHGFYAQKDCMVLYFTNEIYDSSKDDGFNVRSLETGMMNSKFIRSSRDENLQMLEEYLYTRELSCPQS